MDPGQGKKIVLLGMMSRSPVAGVVWQTIHYLLGFQRLGYDVYYVEAHARTPSMLMRHAGDGSAEAAAFIAGVMRRFGLGDRWAFHALHADGRYYGMSEAQLKRLYRSAALIINLHGGTHPLPEHSATGRLVYLETDPVAPQIELHHNVQYTLEFLEPHCAFFTFGENYGKPDCELPVSDRFAFRPTRQPVITDFWRPRHDGVGQAFTTVSSWRQLGREVVFRGEVYHWSKHHEFMKFVDLPTLANQAFELALNRYDEAEKRMLENKGWKVRDALGFSTDADAYRSYITRSRGEFTVAKDQNIRLRSGWFSDRSATYLAAGKPVVTQETGFSNILPTGQGLFAFSVMEEAAQAIESIDADYERHCRAAFELAREYFSYDVVLRQLLADLGFSSPASGARGKASIEAGEAPVDQESIQSQEAAEPAGRFPQDMVLSPVSRRPTILPEATVQTVLSTSAAMSPATYDVVCFCGVDRDPCFEEGSGLMNVSDQNGHRVFHLRPELGEAEGSAGRFETRVLSPHSFEVRLGAGHSPSSEGQVIGNNQEPKLLQALDALRRSYGIEAALGYVRCPSWGPVALQARERWGWKVVHDRFDRAEDSSPSDPALAERERVLENESDLVVRTEDDPQTLDNEHHGQRIALTWQQTPSASWRQVDAAVRAAYKRASFVVVTYDNLVYTKLCLENLLTNTEYPNYEIVVVDNGSTDDTPSYLRSLAAQHMHVRVVLNAENRGFACASNQGLAVATGEVLVLLNNDTIVPRGVLTRLIRHLDDPDMGLIGPVTNRIGNEAQIEVPYATYAGLSRFAGDRMREYEGELFDIRMLAMFCLAMRRDVYERLGLLDERFEVGMLEDDDYAMRARVAGYRVVCAEDAFVHHFGEASFGKLVPTGEYGELLRANRHRFEEKWGIRWEMYDRRPSERYQLLVGRIREVVRNALPPEANVVVVSKGDDELLELNGKQAWHFPQTRDGLYAGYHPADSAEAIAHLEELQAKGGDYLLFPSSAFWWLEHYREFDQYLKSRYRVALHEEETCMIFALRKAETERRDTVTQGNRARGGN